MMHPGTGISKGPLQPTTHTNIPGARLGQGIAVHGSTSMSKHEAKGSEQPVQQQKSNAKDIVGKSDKSRTSYQPGTMNWEGITGMPLFSDVARANIPRHSDNSKSARKETPKFNFASKAPPP